MIFSPKARASTTILMRTKDRPLFLRRALESVLGQTCVEWNLVIINDGGDQAALEDTLNPYRARLKGREHLVHFSVTEGRGKGKHLNAGLNASSSEFVAIHDDDDAWHPEFLTRVKSAIGEHKAIVTQSYLIKERLENGTLTELSREIYEPWQKYAISLFRLAESLTFPPIAFFFRREVIKEIGAFDPELGPLEDWEFALRLLARFECPFLEEPLAFYHQREAIAGGPSANSRMNAKEVYGRLDAEIRNRLLRQDLAEGRLGLGFLVNQAQAHGRVFLELLQKRP